jgi:catechol 2,3-dioxygenase-like lactoylglutathione lyase family enzyme
MFSHIMVGTNDMDKSKAFYDAILGSLGYEPGTIDDKGRCFYITPTGIFSITIPIDGESASPGNGNTIGFAVDSPDAAKTWHATGLANGGTTCEEPPGLRDSALGQLYLAYLRDPAGNKICALHSVG